MRKLKDEGIEIYFEKENIWTLDSKGELLITIMSSLAAELIRRTLCVTDALQEEKSKLADEMAVLVEMTQNIVAENAHVAQDPGRVPETL